MEQAEMAVAQNDEQANVEVGEPIQTTELIQVETLDSKKELVKKEELTITISHGSPFTPEQVVFLGVGSVEKKYATWLNQKFQSGIALINSDKNKVSRAFIRSYSLMQSLCGMAIAEDEVINLDYKYVGHVLPKGLRVEPVVRKFVQDNKEVLQAMSPYYGLKRPMFATAKPELPESMQAEPSPT